VRDVPFKEVDDKSVLQAVEAYGENGARQLRMVKYEDRMYMDARDVAWLIDKYNEAVFRGRWQLFWANVETFILLHNDEDWVTAKDGYYV
jgi:hypothetical protein